MRLERKAETDHGGPLGVGGVASLTCSPSPSWPHPATYLLANGFWVCASLPWPHYPFDSPLSLAQTLLRLTCSCPYLSLCDLPGTGSWPEAPSQCCLFSKSGAAPPPVSLLVHIPPSPTECTLTCTHTRMHTPTCAHTCPRSESYIKDAWEILHKDNFLQIMFGPDRRRKMGSFAGSYWLTHGGGSFWGPNGQAAGSNSRIRGPWSSRDISPLFWTLAVLWVLPMESCESYSSASLWFGHEQGAFSVYLIPFESFLVPLWALQREHCINIFCSGFNLVWFCDLKIDGITTASIVLPWT